MTIPEACNLVLEAGSMGKGGEVYVFDMGEPVKIMDMAKKMVACPVYSLVRISKSTLQVYGQERSFTKSCSPVSENTLPTHHPKILRAKVNTFSHKAIKEQLNLLTEIMIDGDVVGMVRKVKNIVPEYISQNSEFEQLD